MDRANSKGRTMLGGMYNVSSDDQREFCDTSSQWIYNQSKMCYEQSQQRKLLPNAPQNGAGVDINDCCGPEEMQTFYTPLYDYQRDPKFAELISRKNVALVSDKITQLLEGTHPEGKKIVVPPATIRSVLSSVFLRYGFFDPVKIIDETVSDIVGYISDEFITLQKNRNYSIWNTVLGENNQEGLMPHPPIKLKERRPNRYMVCGIY